MKKVSHLRNGGTHYLDEKGTLRLTKVGERMKGRNKNKVYKKDGVIIKYKHHGVEHDEKIVNTIKRWQRKLIKSLMRSHKEKK